MKLALDHLPRTARMLAEVIGLPATLALVLAYRGRTLLPPKGLQRPGIIRLAELEEKIGPEAAGKLAAHFREPIAIPTCLHAIRMAVHEDIRAEFDRLTRQEGYSARAAVDALAGRPPLFYTDRHVWRILSQAGGGEVVEMGQGELF